MLIKKQKHEFKVNYRRRIIIEKNIGLWRPEDFVDFSIKHTEAIKVLNANGILPWAKISDLSEYDIGFVNEEIQKHVEWGVKNGLAYVAIIKPKTMAAKLQIKQCHNDKIKVEYFNEFEQADNWLKSLGFI